MREAARSVAAIEAFIKRWEQSQAAERANYALFLTELAEILGVPHPEPACGDDERDAYVFERSVTFRIPDGSSTKGNIDLYKRGCFVLEAKQGSDAQVRTAVELASPAKKRKKGTAVRGSKSWDAAMYAALGQAESYARALPVSEGWPPFLIVVDVGHTIELFSDFARSGKPYLPFPDPQNFRIKLKELAREEIRDRLRLVWTDPLLLDPSKRSAQVTRKVAARLAVLARSLEESGHAPEVVAAFLMRCLFTMFAEDVGLLPRESFKQLLGDLKDRSKHFAPTVEALWRDMDKGGFSPILRAPVLQFNGGLFERPDALPLDEKQLDLLRDAANADWHDVEPAIFGTLLERALDPDERHSLGAHYTPRSYVERLVVQTVVNPLREDWGAAKAAAVTLARQGKIEAARTEVRTFHRKLCETTVLDPACGSGNFLYVTLEHLKRLEGEVLKTLEDFGDYHPSFEHIGATVDPHQLLGLEINPRAAAIADMVLWIGYLQWHFRTLGSVMPPEPVLKKFQNIQCKDAVLASDPVQAKLDDRGEPVTVWDQRTFKRNPVTRKEVPDELARIPRGRVQESAEGRMAEGGLRRR